ncbi:MAG: 23S rRNA (guanosine(2251)-2'-O)-methyltransferase RlmB [Alphaproteobacteria bacterium 16-39-46]|nr:MAG: 23S rRNA (guanosine(2251)-2'-O)-methyltransferase RlmB [Alphaproteobacteria bacterium 16-39-46]
MSFIIISPFKDYLMSRKKKFKFPQNPPKPSKSYDPSSSGKVWLYGVHAVMAALKNKKRTFEQLIFLQKTAPELTLLLEKKCPHVSIAPTLVDEDVFQKVLPKDVVHQGIALLTSPISSLSLEDILDQYPQGPVTLLCLDQVTDPQNVGAILRSAAAFGIQGLGLTERHSPQITGTLAKAASGALEITPLLLLGNLAQSLELLKKHGFWCLGLDENADQTLSEANLPERVVFVLGSEGEGLRRLSREKCDLLLKIPTSPLFPTLNVSTSAAICLYENHRQKNLPLSSKLQEKS